MSTEEGTKRKLTAILSADVKEYSRLMSQDERGTIRTLTAYREAMSTLIEEYKGRVVDSPGDNLLAEFGSVVDAVNCAVEIQRELAERNAELPPARQMSFRIGINLGDVVAEDGRIYGDGVNIAARMEGLAEGGGICISGTVYDQVKHKLGLEYEYQGEQEVKNIPEPVRVYKVLSVPGAAAHRVVKAKKAVGKTWRNVVVAIGAVFVLGAAVAVWHFFFRPPPIEPASVERMAFPLPEKPSIAVLPFVNMSGDPNQEYLSDGVTENIITALSNIHNMFVIARNSTFAYKGKAAKIQQVAEELGVHYVLEGSIQKTENRMRITAQLIDAITGKHLWAERYDSDLKDLFVLQDEITMKIITALRVKLTEGERANVGVAGTDNLRAYLKIMQASKQFRRMNKEGNALCRKLAEEAIALDPEYADAYLTLSAAHLMDMMYGTSESPKQSLRKAEEMVQKAISLRGGFADARGFLGRIYLTKRQYDLAIAEGERALALAPNSSFVHAALAFSLQYAGRPEEAIPLYKKAIRLSPIADSWYLGGLGTCYRMMGRYEEAISTYKKALSLSPDAVIYHAGQAANYVLAGHMEEAQAEATEVLRIDHKFSLETWRKGQLYKDQAYLEKLIHTMHKAGLPETPPLPLPDKPSIAVMPFVNMSGDPEQEYFSDGMTEEIITALSKTPKLFVIARNSTFTYKNKPTKVQQIGRELGVKYVLEGSVRKAGDKVRITAQLVDAQSGNHLWAERYDGDLKDIFALQDEITKKIITALQVNLTEGEQARLLAKGTNNLEAYLKLLQGREHEYRMNKEDNALARELFEEAIALDPDNARPYAFLATTYLLDISFGSSKSPRESWAKALKLTQKAIALDDSYATAHGFLGALYTMARQHEKAIAASERGVALNPNEASAQAWLGSNLYWADRIEEAIPVIEKAIRLNPIPPSWFLYTVAMAYRDTGRYEEAISACKKVLLREPNNLITHLVLTATYSYSGRQEEARAEAAQVLRIDPKWSLERFAKTRAHKSPANTDRFINALRKAGLK